MSYQAIYLVEYGFREDPFRFANADDNGQIVTETCDGLHIRRYFADAIELYKRPDGADEFDEVLFYGGVPVELLVTDARVTIRIPDYEIAHHRDDTMAALLKSGSEALPAYRREALTLMGMIRYEWISQISYARRVGYGTSETVRLYYRDEGRATWFLDIIFRKEADAEFIANEILHRACRYRMMMPDDKNDKELVFFRQYSGAYDIEPTDEPTRRMSTIRFPTQYPAPTGDL